MKILAIETATEACSAAIYWDGEIISRYELAPRRHTQIILPMLDEVLSEAGISKQALDAIAFGRGPGAFTGLRIAVGIAQGLALALDKPVVPISSLAAMSQQVLDKTNSLSIADDVRYIPAIDARMDEVYWGIYEGVDGEAQLQDEEKISKPEAIGELYRDHNQDLRFGSGWQAYHPSSMICESPELESATNDVFPNAYYVAKLAASAYRRGEIIDAADAEPTYLRNDVAKKKAEQGKSAQ